MALTLGTDAGFVATAPTDDPADSNSAIDTFAKVMRDTSPATAAKIIEVGWWCDGATAEANFEVGLYAADGVRTPPEAGTLLEVSRTNAKGTTAGWKRVTVDWTISPNTTYWIGLQVDDTATTTNFNINTAGGSGIDALSAQDTLPNPFGGGSIADIDGMYSLYAVWEAGAPPSGTNQWINVDDAWRQLSEAWVNVDDSWRKVKEAWINVDDVWRKLYSV